MSDGVEALLNMIRLEVARCMAQQRHPVVGKVTSYDPKKHAVKVKVMPEGVMTGWLPIGTSHIGNNFGFAIGPTDGDQVVISFRGGDPDTPFISGRHYSDDDQPPEVQSGEILAQHKLGAKVFLANDGSLTHTDKNGNAITLHADKSMTIAHVSGSSVAFNAGGDVTVTDTTGLQTFFTGGKVYVGDKLGLAVKLSDDSPSSVLFAKV